MKNILRTNGDGAGETLDDKSLLDGDVSTRVENAISLDIENARELAGIPNEEYAEELGRIIINQYFFHPDFAIGNPERYGNYLHEIDENLKEQLSGKEKEFANFLMNMKVVLTNGIMYLKCENYNEKIGSFIEADKKIGADPLVSNDEMYSIGDSEDDRQKYVLSIIFSRSDGWGFSFKPNVENLIKEFLVTMQN